MTLGTVRLAEPFLISFDTPTHMKPTFKTFTSMYEHKRYRVVGKPCRFKDLAIGKTFVTHSKEVHYHMGSGYTRADTDVFPCLCGTLFDGDDKVQPVERIVRSIKKRRRASR